MFERWDVNRYRLELNCTETEKNSLHFEMFDADVTVG